MSNDLARAQLLGIGDLLIRCLEQRPDNMRRVMAEQEVALAELQQQDPLSFELKVAGLLLRAALITNPRPSATVWDLPRPKEKMPLAELIEMDANAMGDPDTVASFAEFQGRLREAYDEDALPSDRRRLMELRPRIEELKRQHAGTARADVFTKGLALIANISRVP